MINKDKEEFLYKCTDPKFVQDIIDNFHKLYYYSSVIGGTWKNTYWFGIKIQKNPMDLIIYQEIIHALRPDIIIENGTKFGGSALFFAHICDMLDYGEVITIDINGKGKIPEHKRISYLWGNSVDRAVIDFIEKKVYNKRVFIILDSDHSKMHVLKELELYSKFVNVGGYLVVEDTNCSGHPVFGIEGEGPMEAVKEFLKENNNFKIDRNCEKFYLTFNPFGFLRRIK